MARSDLVSNNQETESESEEDSLWRSEEDAAFSPPCPSGAMFYISHFGGDLAQEVAEDKTHHNQIPLVPSGHHSAPIKGRKADKGRKDTERVNNNSSITGERLFDSGLCSCCRRAASEDGPDCRPLPGSSYVFTFFGFMDQSVDFPCLCISKGMNEA